MLNFLPHQSIKFRDHPRHSLSTYAFSLSVLCPNAPLINNDTIVEAKNPGVAVAVGVRTWK